MCLLGRLFGSWLVVTNLSIRSNDTELHFFDFLRSVSRCVQESFCYGLLAICPALLSVFECSLIDHGTVDCWDAYDDRLVRISVSGTVVQGAN